MTTLGTPLSPHSTKVMLLGAGELGKEVLIALQRLGVETIAVDRYDHAPGQQVAHHARTIAMSDPAQLKALIEAERPHLVVPEIEAIATPMLEQLESEGGVRVIPTARAARLTDPALFTEARYARHASQADRHAAFQDHPLALEHFPAGSLMPPPGHGHLD